MSKKRRRFANYTSLIATIGTAILAITALITVFISISAWKDEQESNRPYFTFKESPVVLVKEVFEFEIKFTNVGEHPAVGLWSKSIVIPEDFQTKPIALDEYALVNDIPKNASATLLISLDALQGKTENVQPHYIVISLRYQDPIIDKDFEQELYIRWNGIEEKVIGLTNHAEEEEKQKILQYLEKNEISLLKTK